ncbi:hypothetical protein [Streptomyces sp. NBC_01244]|uniref:hypothetical protein n=1 Tax=Streptomyces sp. NBC_01244 TaxID=2903797 RepID=UPI002E104B8B|nr:hypothetical protein OG247_02825 [Streptomyces sp. NBC_01244]
MDGHRADVEFADEPFEGDIEQLTYDQYGRPCESNRVVYRADRYRFHTTLAVFPGRDGAGRAA